MTRVRVVLLGAGHLGSYHLQKILADDMAELVAVVEPDAGRAHAARQKLAACAPHCPVVADVQQVQSAADAAIIATPTTSHLALSALCFARGWHVLVEKPMAPTAAEGARMIAMAAHHQRLLQVGHLERFNPAVQAALQVAGTPRYVVAERLSPFSGRATDVDVVLDLMIHDLDLLAAFVSAPLTEVRAVGVPVLTDSVDMATARLMFANGTVAQLSAGRTSLRSSRKLRLFSASGYISVDCMARTAQAVHKKNTPGGTTEISGEQLVVANTDALASQDHAFFSAILNGTTPIVDGAAGLYALQLAEAVIAAMDQHNRDFGLSGQMPEHETAWAPQAPAVANKRTARLS
jgi:predicted dehydrogenase